MRSMAFSDAQVTCALWRAESGTPVVEICRKLGQ